MSPEKLEKCIKSLISAVTKNKKKTFFKLLNHIQGEPLREKLINEIQVKRLNALHWAAKLNYVHFIVPLLQARANINQSNRKGTPLYFAASEGHVEAITALKAAGANANEPGEFGDAPILIAVSNGHVDAIAALITAGADVNLQNLCGETPVFIAAKKNQVVALKILIAAGANVHTETKFSRETPMHVAAEHGHSAAIKVLNEAGADVNNNACDVMPIHFAAYYGHVDAIMALNLCGADLNARRLESGATALFFAAQQGMVNAVIALKDMGADLNMPRYNGTTPLYIAACHRHNAVITALKSAGGNMEGVMHRALQRGDSVAIKTLLEAGIEIKEMNDLTPLYVQDLTGKTLSLINLENHVDHLYENNLRLLQKNLSTHQTLRELYIFWKHRRHKKHVEEVLRSLAEHKTLTKVTLLNDNLNARIRQSMAQMEVVFKQRLTQSINKTQENIIEGTMRFNLEMINEAFESQPAHAIAAFNAMISDQEVPAEEWTLFETAEVWDSICEVRNILFHPCPQNRLSGDKYAASGMRARLISEGRKPTEVDRMVEEGNIDGMVYYFKNGFGTQLLQEPQGLLGLTSREIDPTHPIVTKEAVVEVVSNLVSEQLVIQNQRLAEQTILQHETKKHAICRIS